MLIEAFNETGDNFTEMQTTLTDDELVKLFDAGYGGREGSYFTAWGENYVYFPLLRDGAEWVGYAPRNPCDVKTIHWGGE
jgi:hypothetical protein